MSNTPFKMKGHTLPGPFKKKTWPPRSKPFDVDDLIEKKKKKKKSTEIFKGAKKAYMSGASLGLTEAATELVTKQIMTGVGKRFKKRFKK